MHKHCLVASAVGLFVLASSSAASAQGRRRATLADSTNVAESTYARLFATIALAPAEREQAVRAIGAAFVAQQKAQPIVTQEDRLKILRIQEQRDSTLLTLVSDGAERQALSRRLEAELPPFRPR